MTRGCLSPRSLRAFALFFGLVAAGCTGDPEPRAIAVTQADGGLTLIAGTLDRPCEEATSIIIECGRWELEVYLPEGEATDGARSLGQDGVNAFRYRSDGAPDADECTARVDEFAQGTIEIVAKDAASVTFRVDGTTSVTPRFDADGTFQASRCP